MIAWFSWIVRFVKFTENTGPEKSVTKQHGFAF